MSRPIKYKFFYKPEQRFISLWSAGWRFDPENGQIYSGDMNITERFEIVQYTGLKDRNGKEIYEGDVIPPDYALKQNEVAIICYDSNQARFKAVPLSLYKANAGNGGWTGFEVTRHCSIIGNIYENPSLLEDTP